MHRHHVLTIGLSLWNCHKVLTGEESNTDESHDNWEQADEGWAENEKEEKDEHKQQKDGDGCQNLHRSQPICL